ncbi:MAG: HAMP domain-containing sensor histidine kinase, partial [Melioribacteraceae bacterium]|nr:HAMP domain-containing sensor histidine kinase [Melioribacteraceae bacterium]
RNIFSNLTSEPSPYMDDLEFVKYLNNNVINRIKQTVIAGEFSTEKGSKRLVIDNDKIKNLISYKEIDENSINDNLLIRGIQWEMDSLKNNFIQPRINELSKETDLSFYLIPNDSVNISNDIDSSNSVSLAFTKFELPWKFLVVQPALINLDDEIRSDLIILGSFLFLIIVFMITGIFLFVRDFRRETEIMETKTEFMHNVSHELKTPLSLIRLYGETMLIKDNLKEGDKKHALEVITKESERLSHMINNILDFSKIEMGRKEFHFKLGNFSEAIINTINSYRYHLEKKGFVITTEIGENIPKIEFDPEAIEGLVVNLLSNAIKYSDKDKVLMITLTKDDKDIKLRMADRGIGIPEDEIPNIFNRFYRSKHKTLNEVRGSGLGLTLVKHVVDAHNGKVLVESKLGEGSKFTFRFPIAGSGNGDVK